MIEIASRVYIENRYPGPVLGLAVLARGIVLIDAPPCPDAAQTWQHAIRAMNGGFPDRILVLLDHHPDRTLGASIVNGTIVVHEATAQWFHQHASYFRPTTEKRGEVWETCPTLQSPQWPRPHVAFTDQLSLYLGDTPVYVHHRPGPAPGASWLEIPHLRVLFVGDAVVLKEPPFLAEADLEAWIQALDTMLEQYGHYFIVSGREGLIEPEQDIPRMRQRLEEWHQQLTAWGREKQPWSKVSKHVEKWLTVWEPTSERQAQMFRQRLLYGVGSYYRRRFLTPKRRGRRTKGSG